MSRLFNNVRFNTALISSDSESNNTSSGALQVAGGLGVTKNAYVGGIVSAGSVAAASSNGEAAITTTGGIYATKASIFAANLEAGGYLYVKNDIAAALDVTGGGKFGKFVQIMDATDSKSDMSEGSIITAGGLAVTKKTFIGDILTVKSTAPGLSDGTGALITDGGIFAAKTSHFAENVSITGQLQVSGDIRASGSLVTVDSKEVNIGDRYVYLNAQNTVASQAGGIVINHSAESSSNTNNIVGSAAATITLGSAILGLTAGDFIQVHNPSSVVGYAGIYEVASLDNLDVTVKTANMAAWCMSGAVFGTGSHTGAVVAKVNLGILHFEGANGALAYTSANNSSAIIWKYPVAASSGAYASVTLSELLPISKTVTHLQGGTENSSVVLPNFDSVEENGRTYTIVNSTAYTVNIVCHDSNNTPLSILDGETSIVLPPSARVTVVGADNQWLSM